MRNLIVLFVFSLFATLGFSQELTPENIEPFMDGVISAKLKDKNIAGATLAIVKGGEVIVNKGYGYADFAKRIPVSPNQTLFRIGSISKLFVWIAVMQMVEQGKLDLDRDINKYLIEFKIPDSFDGPITLRHLMSHTPGFEDRLIKLFSDDSTKVVPLKRLLPNDLPERIRPSGVQASYSNHGTAIAAHIVEIVSGLDWCDYVEWKILEPLKMQSTTFRQPLPEHLRHSMSKGYVFTKGQMVEKSFEYIPLAPAGAVSTTANDMAIFMQMLLNAGRVNNSVIISDSTFKSMFQPVLIHADGVNPCLHGFMDLSKKGVNIFGHGGDTFWFHSVLAILPEQDMGIFLSFNSQGGESTYVEVIDHFLDKYLNHRDTLLPTINLSEEYLTKFSGEYKINRHPHSDYLKIISLFSRVNVEVKDGKLKILQGEKVDYYLPIDSLSFRKEFESEFIVFQLDEDKEKATFAYLSSLAIFAFERVAVCEGQMLHLTIFLCVIILSLVVIFYWPFVFIIRSKYQPLVSAPKPLPLSAKVSAWISSVFLLVFYIGVALSTSGGPEAVVYSVPAMIKYLLVIPFVLIPIYLYMIFKLITSWPLISTRLRSKVFYTLVCFAHIAAYWQLYYWNLIGWNY
jgi:CubicO group peptidase (beta-lactamase class C family)